MTDFAAARQNMVESQIRTNRVTDEALIAALRTVPREEFVPTAQRPVAYVDEDLAIGGGRYLMEPMVLARMIQEAEVGPHDIVLDIGCATGYSTAVLARLCETVVGLEADADLSEEANELLTEQGIGNAAVVTGEMNKGYAKQAPYDVIIVNGAIAEVPEKLGGQLADGGRLLAVVRPAGGVGRATIMLKSGQTLSGRPLFDASTPYLPGFEPEESFVF